MINQLENLMIQWINQTDLFISMIEFHLINQRENLMIYISSFLWLDNSKFRASTSLSFHARNQQSLHLPMLEIIIFNHREILSIPMKVKGNQATMLVIEKKADGAGPHVKNKGSHLLDKKWKLVIRELLEILFACDHRILDQINKVI